MVLTDYVQKIELAVLYISRCRRNERKRIKASKYIKNTIPEQIRIVNEI
jgi:hypothetical protein